jgi:LytS/YehU family sensor histidine kinase
LTCLQLNCQTKQEKILKYISIVYSEETINKGFEGMLQFMKQQSSKDLTKEQQNEFSEFLMEETKNILAYFDEKKKRKELETTNLKNELNMLRSQVNPHFIFNTLNNIDALILNNPRKASELLMKLSEEMRYMLYDANIEKIEIESELRFLNNYISLQKIRIKQKEPIIVNIDIDNQHEKIPPVLFLPLVENAFKHGRFVNDDDAIKLTMKLKDHHLDFSITNAYEKEDLLDNSHQGLGLDLVKRRFDLIFLNSYVFEIKKEDQRFTVNFSLKLEEA